MEQTPSQRDLDKALADTFPASDPVAIHTEPSAAGDDKANCAPGRAAAGGATDRNQSLQAGASRTSETAGSGGEGRRPIEDGSPDR